MSKLFQLEIFDELGDNGFVVDLELNPQELQFLKRLAVILKEADYESYYDATIRYNDHWTIMVNPKIS